MKNTLVVSIFYFVFSIMGHSQTFAFEELDKFEEGLIHIGFDQGTNEWKILKMDTLRDVNFLDFMPKNCDLVLGGFLKDELKLRLQYVLSNVREGSVTISFLTE